MSAPQPPRGTAHGTLRWYVHRRETRPARFGEAHGPLVWVVTPIVNGRGSKGLSFGGSTICGTRAQALAHAHKQATRTYGPKETRS